MSVQLSQKLIVNAADILATYEPRSLVFYSLLSGLDRDINLNVGIAVDAKDMKDWSSGNIVKAGDPMTYEAWQTVDNGTPELIWQQALTCQKVDFEWSINADFPLVYTIQGTGTRTG